MLRGFILDKSLTTETRKTHPIQGSAAFVGGKSEFTCWDDEPNAHLATMQRDEGQIVIAIRIFQSIDGAFVVSEAADQYSPYSDRFLSNDAVTGGRRESTLREESLRLARMISS